MHLRQAILGVVIGVGAASCVGEAGPGEPFLSVARDELSASDVLRGQVSGTNFYVAVHRSELGKRFFLSSYLKQFYPTINEFDVPAVTLGTHVVTFAVQNGQLVMFDADDRKTVNASFKPTVIIDAFPIVEGYAPFNALPNHADYVLFNPAEGRNEFSVFGNMNTSFFGAEAKGIPLAVHTSFMQRFRPLADGVSFDKVFAGTIPNSDGSLGNWAGTLGMSLRRYVEGAGFEPMEGPIDNYFTSAPFIANHADGFVAPKVTKWNIHPGMKPIPWKVSRDILAMQADPAYAKYDLFGAVKKGVENWNDVFGYTVFTAAIAAPGEERGDDEDNFIIIDPDKSLGFAFADIRANPNSGEIRGASVYFSSSWVDFAVGLYDAPPESPALAAWTSKVAKPKTEREFLQQVKGKHARLGWHGAVPARLCDRSLAEFARGAKPVAAVAGATTTPVQNVENSITEVILHEVGHTLGLRHNFKGSLRPNATQPTSSVMDYGANDVLGKIHTAGPYDVDALKYLYGVSTKFPAQPFCTDEQVFAYTDAYVNDPLCMVFDKGGNPLKNDYGRLYTAGIRSILANPDPDFFIFEFPFFEAFTTANHLYSAQAQSGAEAFTLLTQDIAPPIAPAKLAIPGYAGVINGLRQVVYQFVFIEPGLTPFQDPTWAPQMLAQMKGILENVDGIGNVYSRGQMIAQLKDLQTLEALTVLTEARAKIVTSRATSTGEQLVVANELIRQIDAATSPYFKPISSP